MEHGFPPGATVENVRTAWLIHHGILLGLVAVAAGGHFLPKRRLSQPETLWLWSILLTFSSAVTVLTWVSFSTQWVRLGGSSMKPETVAGYVCLYCVIGFIGSVRTVRGAKRNGEHSRLTTFHAYGNVLCPIVGLYIAAILVPVVSVRGEASFRHACENNLRNIGRAVDSNLDMNNQFPYATSGDPPMSWRLQLLPHLYGGSDIEQYDQQSRWDSEQNLEFSKSSISCFTCPSAGGHHRTDSQGLHFTVSAMLTGPETFSSNFKPRTPEGISDGASNTIAFVEAAGLEIVWTEPRDALVGRELLGINLKGAGDFDSPGIMSGWHTGGAHATFADGSVRFISQDIDPTVLKALTTANGGEKLPQSY